MDIPEFLELHGLAVLDPVQLSGPLGPTADWRACSERWRRELPCGAGQRIGEPGHRRGDWWFLVTSLVVYDVAGVRRG